MQFVDLLAETVDCQILLDHGADVNAVDDEDWTALHFAARYADVKAVEVCIPCSSLPRRQTASVDCQILLEHGADVDPVTDHGWTALQFAAFQADDEIVKVDNAFNSLHHRQFLSTARSSSSMERTLIQSTTMDGLLCILQRVMQTQKRSRSVAYHTLCFLVDRCCLLNVRCSSNTERTSTTKPMRKRHHFTLPRLEGILTL